MITRLPEPEIMDDPEEAMAYDAMDHTDVNHRFVNDALASGEPRGPVLDLGAGNGLIALALMLLLAQAHLHKAGLSGHVRCDLVRAQNLWYLDGSFPLVVSNSLVHHLADPFPALAEAWRVTAPGGKLFFRDLARPSNESVLTGLVEQYAAGAPDRARALFAASLRAAFTVEEIAAMVMPLGCPASSVSLTSDRHWTWSATKPSA
jgi:ubiquinone/menaquinone biosynthesis C-methylase UbiE